MGKRYPKFELDPNSLQFLTPENVDALNADAGANLGTAPVQRIAPTAVAPHVTRRISDSEMMDASTPPWEQGLIEPDSQYAGGDLRGGTNPLSDEDIAALMDGADAAQRNSYAKTDPPLPPAREPIDVSGPQITQAPPQAPEPEEEYQVPPPPEPNLAPDPGNGLDRLRAPDFASLQAPQLPPRQRSWEDELLDQPIPQPISGNRGGLAAALMTYGGGPQAGMAMINSLNQQRQGAYQAQIQRAQLMQKAKNESRYMAELEQRRLNEEGRMARFEKNFGLNTQKQGFKENSEFPERQQARQDANYRAELNAQTRKDLQANQPEIHRQSVALDPQNRKKVRDEYEGLAMPLKRATQGLAVLEQDPTMLSLFTKFGNQGWSGAITNIAQAVGRDDATSNAQKQAMAAIYDVISNEGFGTAGKTLTENEKSVIQSYTGIPFGSGFNPFQSPAVLKSFLRGLDAVRMRRRREAKELYGADIFGGAPDAGL